MNTSQQADKLRNWEQQASLFIVLDRSGQDIFCLTSVALRHAPARDTQPRPGHPHFKLNITWVKLENMKQLRIPGILTILAFALVGCGSTQAESDEPQSAEEAQQQYADELEAGEPEVQTAGHGTYKLHATEGAEIQFDLPTAPSHELLVDLEQFRQDIDAPPATYIVADVDNRNGTIDMNIPQISVYDTEGNEYMFEALDTTLLEWEPEYDDSDEYWETHDRILEFQDELTNGADVAERNTTVLLYHGNDLPEEFTRVAVQPYGLGTPEDAYQSE